MLFINNPLEQFELILVSYLTNIDINIIRTTFILTNQTVFNIFVLFLLAVTFDFGYRNGKVLLKRWEYLLENIYTFIGAMLLDNVGRISNNYFIFVFNIFLFILVLNLVGMIPYVFTTTSHIIVTLYFALAVFIGINIILIRTHGIYSLGLFLPGGAPIALAPLLVLIEVISYFIHVISLSVRLFANMMSGHILLKVLLGFAWTMMLNKGILLIVHLIPLLVVFLLMGLEVGVGIIQAYVFTILICIYLNDAINLH